MSKDLKLYGEQINLINRTRSADDSVKKPDVNKFRPHSAVQIHSKNKTDYGRRPFSAGTEPTSPTLCSFLRYTKPKNSDGPETRNSESFKDSVSIPGTAESTPLFERLINDPISNTKDLNNKSKYNPCYNDNQSENSSVDTYISLGTKIKTKAQTVDRLSYINENYEISGNSITLKKSKPCNYTREMLTNKATDKKYFDFSKDVLNNDDSTKLSVFMPNVKDDNTSSGVSSSSDIYNASANKNAEKTVRNTEEFKNDNLAGRVSFGNSFAYEEDSAFDSTKDQYDIYTTFNTQLSLVEEESSQDSEGSSNYAPYSFDANKSAASRKNNLKYLKQTNSYNMDELHNKNNVDHISITEKNEIDENEIRFQVLEKKYMNGKYGMAPYFDTKNSTLVEKDFNSISFQNADENRLGKLNDKIHEETKIVDDGFNKSYTSSRVREFFAKRKNNQETENIITTPKTNANETRLSLPIEEITQNNEKCRDENKCITFRDDNDELIQHYPIYLNANNSKTYTSKVIEDYKKEINEINNFHNLTIRDLRRKCNDLKGYIKDDPVQVISAAPRKVLLSSSEEENDEVDEIILSDLERAASVNNEEKSSENKRSKSAEMTKKDLKKIELKTDTKKSEIKSKPARKVLTKKATRKKELTPAAAAADKKPKDKFKETLDKRISRRITKFKAQKIALGKCTSRVNHNQNAFNDKDIASWMSTKQPINSPDDDDDEYNSLNSDVKSHHTPRNPTVHFESDVVSILKAPKETKESEESEIVRTDECVEEDADRPSLEGTYSPTNIEVDNYNFSEWINDSGRIGNDLSMESLKDDRRMMTPMLSNEDTTADYRDILNFLEGVEKHTNDDVSSLSHNQPLYALKLEELMDLSKAELVHRAVAGTLAANKAATIAASLKEALNKAAKASAARLKVAKASAKHETSVATSKLTQSIAKHQKFIEQLVNEKKALTERIEQLVASAASTEARHDRAARVAAERLQLELRNQRQRLTVAHQREKQAWLKHHTQKIKEMTVKGLETELQEIERKHAAQLKKVQQDGEAALEELKESHSRETKKLKEALSQQLEDELDKERLLANERLEKKRVEWEMAFTGATERADQKAREAAHRADETIRNARLQTEMWKQEQENELTLKRGLIEKQAEESRVKLMEEISSLKNDMLREFDQYKDDFCKKQMISFKERELEIKASVRRERDKEIEKAIDHMEMEAQEERLEMQESTKRIKEKYEVDIRLLEESEKTANERCKELREQLRELQEQYSAIQITATQLEGKLKQAEEMRLQSERHKGLVIKAAERRERDMAEDLRGQIHLLQQQHKEEMHRLFAKVKVVVARKDDAVTLARREATNLRERCIKLEAKRDY